MRANHHSLKLLVLASAIMLASCTAVPTAQPPAAPTQAPVPAPTRPVTTSAPSDWRDKPATPGDWTWSMEGSRSVARFAGGALVLSCDPSARTVTLIRQGAAQGPVPMTIMASDIARQITGSPISGPPPAIAVTLPASDNVLDAMAFSRGRFAVETSGQPTLYVPSWPEVSRVIEDCR
jgi:hypothetical protein